jgi:tRNA A-37 threonylcarbamoyl transferase component Bud32
MGNSLYKKISKGKMRGWVREELLELLPSSFFEDPISFVRERGGEVIKESKLRWAAILTLPGGRRIFFKRDKTKGWLESLKFLLLPSKARREWFIAYRLRKSNLPIPRPLGWMERVRWGWLKESYYLSEAIGSGVSFIEDSIKKRESFWTIELAKTVRKVHEAGLFHKDLHAGNFLWNGESFYLIDLHRAKILKVLSLKQRLWNLSQLFHSLRSAWEEEEQIKFIEKYFDGEPVYFQKKEELLKKIHSLMDHLQKRQWQSRTKRCLKESTEFSIKKERGVLYHHRKDFPLGHLKEVIEEHRHFVKERPLMLVKNSSEITISILKDRENNLCVKQFRYPHIWDRMKEQFRHSKGLKAWIAANGLRARGIPSLRPLALVEKRSWSGLKESYFLLETFENDQELDRYILKGFSHHREKRLFIKTFAQWLSNFHKMGLYHQDMKTCNILISKTEETWNFRLLDLEDVRLNERVDERRLLKNFLQLNTSTPRIMTRMDRLRFFREYIRLNPMIKNQKGFLRQLIEESRRRGLVYVSPHGVVMETM